MAEPIATLQAVVAFLNAERIRATYGAVAHVTGGIARGIGARLTAIYGRGSDASWVVSAATGKPSGYSSGDLHPALFSKSDIITDGDDLRRRMATRNEGASLAQSTTTAPRLGPKATTTIRPTDSVMTVDELSRLRRELMVLLDSVDPAKVAGDGIRKRINRLSQVGGPVPRHVAALMTAITEMRNSAEYEAKVLTASESAMVRHAWQAIQEWIASARKRGDGPV